MLRIDRPFTVAIVGAGLAGAWCAHALSGVGAAVTVIDKSRGAGGRLSTRQLDWVDRHGVQRRTAFDHGAPGFTAVGGGFQAVVARAVAAGVLASWEPTVAEAGRPCASREQVMVGVPDMPALCRWLLQDLPAHWGCTVEGLQQGPTGWLLTGEGAVPAGPFDAVVLALPPAQAAPLLAPHRRDWAQRASIALMQPCWTLMGVSNRPAASVNRDVARPQRGPLSWVIRNDARPGRGAPDEEAHWVLHARAGWSRRHLEHPAVWVQAQLQAALQDWLGEALAWQQAVVHRWRYARPVARAAATAPECWWDGALGLGVCGDFMGGVGAEGAWSSADNLAWLMRSEADPVGFPEVEDALAAP